MVNPYQSPQAVTGRNCLRRLDAQISLLRLKAAGMTLLAFVIGGYFGASVIGLVTSFTLSALASNQAIWIIGCSGIGGAAGAILLAARSLRYYRLKVSELESQRREFERE